MNVGRTLRHARRRARLTQRQLAVAAGVPQSTVARIEVGATMPRVDTFERLLEACGMDIELTEKRGRGVDLEPIREMLKLTPDERVRRGLEATRTNEATDKDAVAVSTSSGLLKLHPVRPDDGPT